MICWAFADRGVQLGIASHPLRAPHHCGHAAAHDQRGADCGATRPAPLNDPLRDWAQLLARSEGADGDGLLTHERSAPGRRAPQEAG